MIYQLESIYKDSDGQYRETIKIGYSSENFEGSRKQAYDTHNPGYRFLGEIKGTKDDEGWLHWLFRDDLIKGEWFKDSPEIHLAFKNYNGEAETRSSLKTFMCLSRYSPLIEEWRKLCKAEKEDWIQFLWDLSQVMTDQGLYGEIRQDPVPVWSDSSRYLPKRQNLRKALGKVESPYSRKLLEWVEDIKDPSYPGLFDPGFLVMAWNDYKLPIYPGILKAYCEYLDKFPEREDIKRLFYDPRFKEIYETLGTEKCKEYNFNLQRIYEEIRSFSEPR
jgi:hypothetical protein